MSDENRELMAELAGTSPSHPDELKHKLELAHKIYRDVLVGEGYSVDGSEGVAPDRRAIFSILRLSIKAVFDGVATAEVSAQKIRDAEG